MICPPVQCERFLARIAGRGIPHAYLAFEGEGHGFRREETMIASMEAELSLYGQIFGFEPPGIPRRGADHVSAVPLTRPPRLRPGDRVAVVTPAGPGPKDLLERGLRAAARLGSRGDRRPRTCSTSAMTCPTSPGRTPTAPPTSRPRGCDPDVDAVICSRGGYGAQRMVDLLDWPAMREARPKVFVGYSDITALHEAFATQLGVVTVHGPLTGFAIVLGRRRQRRSGSAPCSSSPRPS